MNFELSSPFSPTGDQPEAIAALSDGIKNGVPFQTLLGVTGYNCERNQGGTEADSDIKP